MDFFYFRTFLWIKKIWFYSVYFHPYLTDVCQCLPLDQNLPSNCPLSTGTEIQLIPFCPVIHHYPVSDLKTSLPIIRGKQDEGG